jgi:hypothetical protein
VLIAYSKVVAQKKKPRFLENRGSGLNMIALKSTYDLVRMHTLRLSRYSNKGVAVGKSEIRKAVHI